jgi:glycosyltransferase 2 family protein
LKKKLLLGLLLSTIFTYLSLRGINFEDVATSFKTAHYIYIIPALFILLFVHYLRSYRWGVILRPIEKIDPFSLFSVTCVGFLAIVAIPARIGELARPYLITHKSNVTMTSALGSVFLERVFDVLTILIMLFMVAFLTPMPSWLMKSGIVFFVITLIIIALMILLGINRSAFFRIVNPVISRLPEKYFHRIEDIIDHFISGFKMVANPGLILYVTFLSLLIWASGALVIYILFSAFDLQLSLIAAFAVMVVVIAGTTIPTAPGFVGSFHYFCILGLSLYGIPKTDAFIYAILYHFLSIGMAVGLGLIFLPFNLFFISDLKKSGV